MIATADYRAPTLIARTFEDYEQDRALAEIPAYGVYKYSNAWRHLRPGQAMPASRVQLRAPVDPRVTPDASPEDVGGEI